MLGITLFGIALLGVAGWFSSRLGIAPSEIAGLVESGGDRQLREPMRSPGEGIKVLLIALDGVGHGVLEQLLEEERLPRLGELLGARDGEFFEHGVLARGMSVLPSTTMAAWASIYTGEPPAETGVPGNEWFVREERRFYAPAPVSVGEYTHTLEMLTEGLVGQAIAVPTLYEKLERRAFVALAPVYRGADLFLTPAPEAVGAMFLETVDGVSSGDLSREIYSEIDEETVENLAEGIEAHGIPDLQVVYFPGIDLFTHVAEGGEGDELRYLQEVTDPAIGNILDLYRERGALDDTVVVLISDHGHTSVQHDDRHALGWEGEDEPPELLRQLGFRVRAPSLELSDDEEDYQAVLAYQGAMAYIYLADRSTCEEPGTTCDWTKPPRFEEDVMPVIRAFAKASAEGKLLPGLEGSLDLILSREPRPVTENALAFEVHDGGELIPIADYLERQPRPDLLRFEERMGWLAEGPYGHRAGDVLLLAKSGEERPIEDRYYFSHEYRSWHGSPSAQDSLVPLLIAQSSRSGRTLQEELLETLPENFSQLDYVALLLRIFSRAQ